MKILSAYFLLITILIGTDDLFAQEADSLIELYPGIGKTLSILDKEYYNLFNQFKEFERGELFIKDDKYLVSKIRYFLQGGSKDTILVQPISVLDTLRLQISTIQEEYDIKFDSPIDVKILTVTGDQYEGKLEMFGKKYLYLYSEEGISTGGTSHLRIKIPVSDVEAVVIPGESNTLSGLVYGSLAGGVIGFIVGAIYTKDQQCFLGTTGKLWSIMAVGGFGMIIGGLVGLLVGGVSSSSDEVIEIVTIGDLIKLKEYAKYNPGDKSPPGVKYFQLDSL